MAPTYKKGDLVTYIGDWDRKGTAFYRHAVVYSCGKKQMVLTDAATGEEMGRNYKPGVDQYSTAFVLPRMTDEEAVAKALEVGAAVIVSENAHYARCLANNCGESYDRSIRKSMAELHEPRAVRHDEACELIRLAVAARR